VLRRIKRGGGRAPEVEKPLQGDRFAFRVSQELLFAEWIRRFLSWWTRGGPASRWQAINDSIPNGLFVLSFVGAPLLLIVATALHAASRSRRLAPLLLACGLVIGGGLLVTFLANVPLNDELAAVDPDAGRDVLARARADYEDPWNTWNAVRTITCTAALACLAWALRPPASRPPTAE
jgi:uncharacterized membrane protein